MPEKRRFRGKIVLPEPLKDGRPKEGSDARAQGFLEGFEPFQGTGQGPQRINSGFRRLCAYLDGGAGAPPS